MNRAFIVSVFLSPAKIPAFPGHICGKMLAKGPGSPEAGNNMEQQLVVVLMKTEGVDFRHVNVQAHLSMK